MKTYLSSLLVILITTGLASRAGAGEFDAKQVAADSHWFLHLDLAGFKKTQLGKFVFGQTKQFTKELDELAKELKFDIRTDLDSATIYGHTTKEGQEEDLAILFKGNFKAKAILAMLRTLDEFKQHKTGGHQFFSWMETDEDEEEPAEPETVFAAIVNDGLIALGTSQKRLVNALDVLKGKAPSLQPKQLAGLQLKKGSYFLAGVINVKDLPVSPEGKAFKVQSIAFRLGEQDKNFTTHLLLNSANANSSLQIQQMLQGMLALGQMQSNAAEDPASKELAALLKNLKIVRHENVVQVDFAYPAAKLIKQLKQDLQVLNIDGEGNAELNIKFEDGSKKKDR